MFKLVHYICFIEFRSLLKPIILKNVNPRILKKLLD